MKLSTSSDGSGLVWLPPFHSVLQVKVNDVVTSSGFTVGDNGIQFSPIPPAGYSIEVTLNESKQRPVVEAPSYSQRVDVASSTVTYIGEANPGSLETDPVWRIKKLESNAEGDANIYFAGASKFNQVWADRTSLAYS